MTPAEQDPSNQLNPITPPMVQDEEPKENDAPILPTTYWANLPEEDLGNAIMEKVNLYFEYGLRYAMFDTWMAMYYKYYIAEMRMGHILTTGMQGEYLAACFNKFRTNLNGIYSLTTSQKVVGQPIAINDSYISEAQTQFATNIMDYFIYTKRNEIQHLQAARWALIMGESGVFYDFNDKAGPEGIGKDGQPTPLGDVEVTALSPVDIIRDPSANSFDEENWVILRLWRDKYQVAARFGNNDKTIIDQIMASRPSNKYLAYHFGHYVTETDWDTINIYCLLHKKTAANPDGNITFCLENGTVLANYKLSYTRLPFARISYEDIQGNPFGTSISYSLSILQEMLDTYLSSALTNVSFWGVPNISATAGGDTSIQDLTGGGKVYQNVGGKVEVLDFLKTSPEVFSQIDRIGTQMDQLCGLSPTILGQAANNSGTAQAFSAAQSVQFQSPFARSWQYLNEAGMTILLEIIKTHASTDLLKEIAGEGQSWKSDFFTSDPLKDITRIKVETVNPQTKSYGGAIEMVQNMASLKLIPTPDQYMSILNEVMTTGRITTVSNEETLNMNVKNTISRLLRGEYTPAYHYDNHPIYIQYIVAALNPDIRASQPQIVKLCDQMSQEHMQMWLKMTQAECLALGITPAPQPPTPPQPHENKVSESISFKDLPPAGQVQMAKQAGIDLTGSGAPMSPPPSPMVTPPPPQQHQPQQKHVPGHQKPLPNPSVSPVQNKVGHIREPNAPLAPKNSNPEQRAQLDQVTGQ